MGTSLTNRSAGRHRTNMPITQYCFIGRIRFTAADNKRSNRACVLLDSRRCLFKYKSIFYYFQLLKERVKNTAFNSNRRLLCILCLKHMLHKKFCNFNYFLVYSSLAAHVRSRFSILSGKLHSFPVLYNFGCTPNFYNRRWSFCIQGAVWVHQMDGNVLWLVAAYKFAIKTSRFSLIDDAAHKTRISSHYLGCYQSNESILYILQHELVILQCIHIESIFYLLSMVKHKNFWYFISN